MKFDNLEDVHSFIQDIDAAEGRTEKERLLTLFLADPLAVSVVRYAYDPFITFGITPPEKVERHSKAKGDFAWISPLLDSLASRSVTGSDAAARVTQTLEGISERAAEVLRRILKKDLRCGVGTSTINKVMPGLIPVFGVMRAHNFEEKRIKEWPVAVEPKLDGFRGVLICKGDTATIWTRGGLPMTAAQGLADEIHVCLLEIGYDPQLLNLDGEVISGSFQKTSGDLRRKSVAADDAVFQVFDAFDSNVFAGAKSAPYAERRELVMKVVADLNKAGMTRVEAVPSYLAWSTAEIMGFYDKFRGRGLEGAMVKKRDGFYKAGKSHDWGKIKAEETEDLTIIGAYSGKPGTNIAHCLGGVIVNRFGVEVHVGGGWSAKQREELWLDWLHDEALKEADSVLLETDAKLLGRMIEVEFHEVTPDGSLRHPRFLRWRDDKAAEAKLELAA